MHCTSLKTQVIWDLQKNLEDSKKIQDLKKPELAQTPKTPPGRLREFCEDDARSGDVACSSNGTVRTADTG
jgi:hypothetical protein